MLIKIAKPWEIPERQATPEYVYWNRRDFLKAAGIAAFSVIAGCAQSPEKAQSSQKKITDPSISLYPGKRNPEFKLDRQITSEEVAARYNNYYEFTEQKDVYRYVDDFQIRPWTIDVTGLVRKPQRFDLDTLLRRVTLEERLYRHRCVEAWSMAVPWTGFRFLDLMKLVEPTSKARYVRLVSFLKPSEAPGQQRLRWYPWPYFEGLSIAEAANELTLLATGIYGHPLPVQHGSPIRLVVPWKYGYKSIKGIVKIEFTDERPATFWNNIAPDEYGFVSNVDPSKPHPRWSQETERIIDTGQRIPTLPYNGYGEYVASLYRT